MREWIDTKEIFEIVEKAKNKEWRWSLNHECKYIDLRIDMRDGHCLLTDRHGKEISLEKLQYQYERGQQNMMEVEYNNYDEEYTVTHKPGRTPLSAKVNRQKKCFRKSCSNKRGDRGLYCSAECARLDK